MANGAARTRNLNKDITTFVIVKFYFPSSRLPLPAPARENMFFRR